MINIGKINSKLMNNDGSSPLSDMNVPPKTSQELLISIKDDDHQDDDNEIGEVEVNLDQDNFLFRSNKKKGGQTSNEQNNNMVMTSLTQDDIDNIKDAQYDDRNTEQKNNLKEAKEKVRSQGS